MTYSNELFKLPQTWRSTIKKLESTKTKLIKAKWSSIFNDICLKENLLPNYTRMRHHDPALALSRDTVQYRKSIVIRELKIKKETQSRLELEEVDQITCINNSDANLSDVLRELNVKINSLDNIQKSITLKKLNQLYNGQILLKEEVNCFLNLSQYDLSGHEKEFLNLGLNFHLQHRYDTLHKKTELEILYNSL